LSIFHNTCKGRSKNERELIEFRSKGEDLHDGISCSSASWDKTTMAQFDPIDSTNHSFIVASVVDF
jgi:hypothetical protein